MSTPEYTRETTILDYRHPSIEELVLSRGWRDLSDFDRIGGVYSFVRDEIAFGYNADDALNASAVLRDGYGQCNTKGTLLMALLRAVDIPCRFHGFTIENDLQRGAIPGYMLPLGPPEIIHSWVEVEYRGRWLNIEGFILDLPYLRAVQKRFADTVGGFSGYAVATKDLANPRSNGAVSRHISRVRESPGIWVRTTVPTTSTRGTDPISAGSSDFCMRCCSVTS
jgi:transglutaminase-like putative cysteine protease